MRSRIVAPALLAVSLVTAGPAHAAVKEAVVVVPADAGSASAAPAVARALEAWTAKSGRYSPVSVADTAMGDGPAKRQAAAKTGAAKLQAGLTAYDSLSYDEALADLDAAAKAYLDSDIRDHLKGLLDVYGARVLALYYAGKVADARNQLIDIFTLDHDYQFDKTRMTPDVQQVVNGVRANQTKIPTTSLEVQTSPANAQVWVDGNYVGVSPAEAKGLTPGYHMVTAVRPGYAFSQSRQLAAPGKLVEVKLQAAPGKARLDALLQGVAAGFKKQAWSRPEAALAKWAGAKQVLAVRVTTGAQKGLHLDGARVANDGHLLAVSSADVPSGHGLAQAVMAFAAGHPQDRPAPGPRRRAHHHPLQRPLLRRPQALRRHRRRGGGGGDRRRGGHGALGQRHRGQGPGGPPARRRPLPEDPLPGARPGPGRRHPLRGGDRGRGGGELALPQAGGWGRRPEQRARGR